MLSSPFTDAIVIRINIGRILISGERQGLRHPLEIERNISPHLLKSNESEMIKISLLCHIPLSINRGSNTERRYREKEIIVAFLSLYSWITEILFINS